MVLHFAPCSPLLAPCLNNKLFFFDELADIDQCVAHATKGCIDAHIREAGYFFERHIGIVAQDDYLTLLRRKHVDQMANAIVGLILDHTHFAVWIIAFEYFRQFVMFVSPRRKRDWMLWTALVCFLIGLVLGALDDLGVCRMGPLTEYAAWYGFCAFMIFTTFMFAREFGAIAISPANLAATLDHRVAMRTDELSADNAELQEEVRERRRAQETLVAHERRLEAVYEGTWDAVWLLSKEGVIDCNRRTLEMFGYATKEDFARAYPAALSPEFQADGQETRVLRAAVIQSAIETGHRTFAWTHRRANGELFPAEVLLSAFEYEGRMVWQATIRDMTERKRMETALRESEQRMADIINSLPDPTFVIDSQHRVIAWNRAIEEQTGVKREDMLGKGNYEYSLPYHGDRRPLSLIHISEPTRPY